MLLCGCRQHVCNRNQTQRLFWGEFWVFKSSHGEFENLPVNQNPSASFLARSEVKTRGHVYCTNSGAVDDVRLVANVSRDAGWRGDKQQDIAVRRSPPPPPSPQQPLLYPPEVSIAAAAARTESVIVSPLPSLPSRPSQVHVSCSGVFPASGRGPQVANSSPAPPVLGAHVVSGKRRDDAVIASSPVPRSLSSAVQLVIQTPACAVCASLRIARVSVLSTGRRRRIPITLPELGFHHSLQPSSEIPARSGRCHVDVIAACIGIPGDVIPGRPDKLRKRTGGILPSISLVASEGFGTARWTTAVLTQDPTVEVAECRILITCSRRAQWPPLNSSVLSFGRHDDGRDEIFLSLISAFVRSPYPSRVCGSAVVIFLSPQPPLHFWRG